MFSADTKIGNKVLVLVNQPRRQNNPQPVKQSWGDLNYNSVECDLQNLSKDQFMGFLGHVKSDTRFYSTYRGNSSSRR